MSTWHETVGPSWLNPLFLSSAELWLKAAGRPDLLGKNLERLIKYHVCADHFERDCFLDPDTKTRLKKTKVPVTAPIPTIFENNLKKYIPQQIHPHIQKEKRPKAKSYTYVISANDGREAEVIISQEPNIEMEQIRGEVQVYTDEDEVTEAAPVPSVIDVEEGVFCRMCFLQINNRDMRKVCMVGEVEDALTNVVPGLIHVDDASSQVFCTKCHNDLMIADKIVTRFKQAQQDYGSIQL